MKAAEKIKCTGAQGDDDPSRTGVKAATTREAELVR